MNCLVDGHTNTEITELLHMAEKTVELHLHNIRKAMGMHRTVVAALAWDRFRRPATTHPAETAQPLAGT
jgi:DNA-binding NarL/FixJ family response regulator